MTAAQLGEALDKQHGVKWDRFTVASLENGKRQNVTVDELFALAAVFEISPIFLATGDDPDEELTKVKSLLWRAAGLLAAARQGRGLLDEIEASEMFTGDELTQLQSLRSAAEAGVFEELRRHADEKHGRA